MQGIPFLILTFVAVYLGHKLLLFLKALQAIEYVNFWKSDVFLLTILRYHPGKRIIISSSLLNTLLPKIGGFSLGENHLFIEKHKCERH